MKDEGVMKSQVYVCESPGKKEEIKLVRSKFIYTSHLSLVSNRRRFYLRFVWPETQMINRATKEVLFSIYNDHCLIELDPVHSPENSEA